MEKIKNGDHCTSSGMLSHDIVTLLGGWRFAWNCEGFTAGENRPSRSGPENKQFYLGRWFRKHGRGWKRRKGRAANETYAITWITSWNFISWSSEKQYQNSSLKAIPRGVEAEVFIPQLLSVVVSKCFHSWWERLDQQCVGVGSLRSRPWVRIRAQLSIWELMKISVGGRDKKQGSWGTFLMVQ